MKKTTSTLFLMTIIAVGIIGVYYYQKNRTDPPKESLKQEEEITILLEKDINKEYPPTAKEVINLYNRIIKEMHTNKKDENIEKLGIKIRDLYDIELLEQNKLEDYLFDLKIEIASYRDDERVIRSYEVYSEEPRAKVVDGKEYTTINSMYRIKDKNGFYRLTEEFILRRDEDGRWKILGWKVIESKAASEE